MAAAPAPFPLAVGRNRLGFALLHVNRLLIRLSRSLFAYQMVFVCRPMVSLDWLLAQAEAATPRRRAAEAEAEPVH